MDFCRYLVLLILCTMLSSDYLVPFPFTLFVLMYETTKTKDMISVDVGEFLNKLYFRCLQIFRNHTRKYLRDFEVDKLRKWGYGTVRLLNKSNITRQLRKGVLHVGALTHLLTKRKH